MGTTLVQRTFPESRSVQGDTLSQPSICAAQLALNRTGREQNYTLRMVLTATVLICCKFGFMHGVW